MRKIRTLIVIALVAAELCAACVFSTSHFDVYETFSDLCYLWFFVLAGILVALVLSASYLWRSLTGKIILILALTLLCMVAAIDLVLLNQIGLFSFEVFRDLPIDLFNDRSLPELRAYGIQNFSIKLFLIAVFSILVPAWTIWRAKLRRNLSRSTAVLSIIVCLAVICAGLTGALPKTAQASLTDAYVTASPLHKSDRSKNFKLQRSSLYSPQTIILVINESAGALLNSSDDKSISLEQRLAQISGAPNDWFIAANAVTNSNCTEVSIPSLITGSGSHESIEKLHEMPFIFDMAKARGYQTIFYTSTTLRWSNLNAFFSAAKIDETYSAETSGGFPLVNDLGIDDAVPINKLSDYILKASGPQFIVIYTNALHTPFQVESRIPIPQKISDRRSRAIYLIETEHKMMFDALRTSGRYDDSLIVLIGDHGERLDDPRAPKTFVPRLENYSEPVLRPIFMIKPPMNMPRKNVSTLRQNHSALIANLDIAPTIADMLGISLSNELSYGGQSLFKPVPVSRFSIATSTNEWRNWTRTAVAISQGQSRLVCDSFELCKSYEVKSDGSIDAAGENKAKAQELMTEALKFQ